MLLQHAKFMVIASSMIYVVEFSSGYPKLTSNFI